jgi:hypothetical protein
MASPGSFQDQNVSVVLGAAVYPFWRCSSSSKNGCKQLLCDLWAGGFLEALTPRVQYGEIRVGSREG